MAVHYTNRTGKTYYLRQGKTKTGKPRYFFSSQQHGKGQPVEDIPKGYEIYEHPENAQVFLRKTRPQLITDIEKQLVKKYANNLVRSRRYRVDCKDEYITIYESNADTENFRNIFDDFLNPASLRPGMTVDNAINTLLRAADQHYTAMLRFRLADKERRTFTAERFCFRGSIDNWIYLGGPDHLKNLTERYIELLGTDNFFNTPY